MIDIRQAWRKLLDPDKPRGRLAKVKDFLPLRNKLIFPKRAVTPKKQGGKKMEMVSVVCPKCKEKPIALGRKKCEPCLEKDRVYQRAYWRKYIQRKKAPPKKKVTRRGKRVKRFGNLVCGKCGKADLRVSKKSVFCNICTPLAPPRPRSIYIGGHALNVLYSTYGRHRPFVHLTLGHSSLHDAKQVRVTERDGGLFITKQA